MFRSGELIKRILVKQRGVINMRTKKGLVFAVALLTIFALVACRENDDGTNLTSFTMDVFVFGSGEEGHLFVQGLDHDDNHIGFFVLLYDEALNSEGEEITSEYLVGAIRARIDYDGTIHNTSPRTIHAHNITVLERGHWDWERLAYEHPEEFSRFKTEYPDFLHGEGFSDLHNKAIDLYFNLLDHYREVNGESERGFGVVLPDYIGGFYHNERGELVIQIAVDFLPIDEAMASIGEIIDIASVVFYPAQFSHNQLSDMADYLFESDEIWDFVDSFGVSEPENRVLVWLTNYSPEDIERFRTTIIDSSMIIFTESEESVDRE